MPLIALLKTDYSSTGIFPSYEAFLAIVDTMIIQFAKFVKVSTYCEVFTEHCAEFCLQVAQETTWRPPVPSLNYIETSTLWRQERAYYLSVVRHCLTLFADNGYSHQAPGRKLYLFLPGTTPTPYDLTVINTLLTLPGSLVRVYLPADGNCAVSCMDHCCLCLLELKATLLKSPLPSDSEIEGLYQLDCGIKESRFQLALS